MMRVGLAGYIETPSPFLEQGLALGNQNPSEFSIHAALHKWFVFSNDGGLIFEPKTPEEANRFCSCRDGQFMKDFYSVVDFQRAQHCFRRAAKTTVFYWNRSFKVEVRNCTLDCVSQEDAVCRFRGMKRDLVSSCNDWFRIGRSLELKKAFPECSKVLRRYGYHTLAL